MLETFISESLVLDPKDWEYDDDTLYRKWMEWKVVWRPGSSIVDSRQKPSDSISSKGVNPGFATSIHAPQHAF